MGPVIENTIQVLTGMISHPRSPRAQEPRSLRAHDPGAQERMSPRAHEPRAHVPKSPRAHEPKSP
jgi:hypothetical protein